MSIMSIVAPLFLAAAAQSAPMVVTDCDRLAAHPNDPDRVTAGVPERQVDTAAAIAACKLAVAADPANGRLNYQLARALGYAGRGKEAAPYREAAVQADYPQALFVVGYIHLFGFNDAERDACKAGDLIRRSALKGRQAGLVGFPHWTLAGKFNGCSVPQDKAEMLRFTAQAKAQLNGDFYQTLLVEGLEARLAALP
jgi:TPR repeat protein